MPADRDLADRARKLAAAADPGSIERRAFGCASVALSTTSSIPAARRVLAGWNGPADVQAAAMAALDELAAAEATR